MNSDTSRIVIVTGATGRQGGAVARSLLNTGWRVRALTRNPNSQKAQALAALGAEVVQGTMDERQSLRSAFEGAYGVFSVQNPMLNNLEREVRQGMQVADAAKAANVQHIVYTSTGTGKATGIGSWDSKLQIEAHMKHLGLPLTILRPKAFLELMNDKGYYPAVSTWHLMPKLMGDTRPMAWVSVQDVGIIAAKAFADPDRFVGEEINLTSDVKSIDECRAIYRDVMGKNPARFPMPMWLFHRFVGTDLTTMWTWLRTGVIDLDTTATLRLHPEALGAEAWLRQQKAAQGAAA